MKLTVSMSDKQWELIQAQERYVLMSCGIGFGKTVAGCYWVLLRAINNPGANCLVAARDYKQIKDAISKELLDALDKLGFIEDRDFTYHKSDFHFKLWNGSEIQCRTSSNHDSNFRASSYPIIWLDEAEFIDSDAYDAILGRLRGGKKLGIKEQFCVTSSPNGFGHVYKHFYSDSKLDKRVIFAPATESPWVDNEQLEAAKILLSPRKYRQEILAERLNLAELPVYSEFDNSKHVLDLSTVLKPTDMLLVALDYNIGKYPAVFMIERHNVLYVIDEIFLKEGNSYEMARQIRAKIDGWGHKFYHLIGDHTGNNKGDVSADKNNYQIFREHGLNPKHFYNPPVIKRHGEVNSHFYGDRLFVDKRCKKLILDLETVTYDKNGIADQKGKNSHLTHISDALGYGCWQLLPTSRLNKTQRNNMIRI